MPIHIRIAHGLLKHVPGQQFSIFDEISIWIHFVISIYIHDNREIINSEIFKIFITLRYYLTARNSHAQWNHSTFSPGDLVDTYFNFQSVAIHRVAPSHTCYRHDELVLAKLVVVSIRNRKILNSYTDIQRRFLLSSVYDCVRKLYAQQKVALSNCDAIIKLISVCEEELPRSSKLHLSLLILYWGFESHLFLFRLHFMSLKKSHLYELK